MRVLVESNCSGGACPTVYEDDDGSIYVQGYDAGPEALSKVTLPEGETLVRINQTLLNAIRAS